MRDLYAENYKTFVKLIDDDSKKWKDNPMLLDGKNLYC